jgi:signal transduction histidine kinase
VRGVSYIVVLIFSYSFLVTAQNKQIADSCRMLLINDKTGNDSTWFVLMSKVAFNQTNPDSIIYYSDILIDRALQKNNSTFSAKGYYLKSIGLIQQSKSDIALELLIKCINEASKNNNEKLIANANVQMGNVYSSMNNYDYSISCYLKAIELMQKQDAPSALAAVFLNLGSDYTYLCKKDSALHYFTLSDSLYSLLNDKLSGAYAKGNIGIILAERQLFDSAWVYLSASHHILLGEEHYQAAISYRIWLSFIKQKQNRLFEAYNLAASSLVLAKEQGLKEQIRDSYEQLASIHTSMGQYQKANEALVQYYAYRDSIVNTETITQMANLRTEFEVGQKQAELDAMAENERFKTLIAWILLAALSSVAVLLLIVYRHNRHNKRLLAQLKIQKAELELANETKDRFFSVISHDLRGPMGAIGNLVLLANDALVNEEMAELRSLLNMMGENSREVESLLNNLLHWSVGQRGAYQKHFDTINFSQLVNNVISIYTPIAIAKGIELTFLPSQPNHLVVTDPNSWAVIVRNLVNNAIKFTHTGGKVKITVSQRDNLLVLQVSDTGIGMEASVVDNLFKSAVNRPQWGTNYEKGMGIGLSLIKDFVDINEGKIEVASVLGNGTVFTVTIPVGAATQTISDRNT